MEEPTLSIIMKNILNYITLLSVAALVSTAVFELAGGTVSTPVPYAVPFALFVSGLVLSTFRVDYGRSDRRFEPRRVRPILLPADEVFAADGSARVSATAPVSWTVRHRRVRREVARF